MSDVEEFFITRDGENTYMLIENDYGTRFAYGHRTLSELTTINYFYDSDYCGIPESDIENYPPIVARHIFMAIDLDKGDEDPIYTEVNETTVGAIPVSMWTN